MSALKPEQGKNTRLIGGWDVDAVFAPNDEFIQNIFNVYDRACSNHIRSSIQAVSDKSKRMGKQAAFDLGVKEGISAILHLIHNTDPYSGEKLTALDSDQVIDLLDDCRVGFDRR